MITTDESESFHDEKVTIRQYLLDNGWRRDGRSKKFEVYKIKQGTLTYRAKFWYIHITIDRMIPEVSRTRSGEQGTWEHLNDLHYTNITRQNIRSAFGVVMILSEEDLDTDEYLNRLGVL